MLYTLLLSAPIFMLQCCQWTTVFVIFATKFFLSFLCNTPVQQTLKSNILQCFENNTVNSEDKAVDLHDSTDSVIRCTLNLWIFTTSWASTKSISLPTNEINLEVPDQQCNLCSTASKTAHLLTEERCTLHHTMPFFLVVCASQAANQCNVST